MTADELRKRVLGFPGYWAGVDGRIYSTWPARGRFSAKKSPSAEPRVLRAATGRNGYLYVSLRRDGKDVTRTVHSLVCEAWHGQRPKGMQVCHGGADKADNRPSNLSWGTPAKNSGPDKIRDGRVARGEKQGHSKLTVQDVRRIRELLGQGMMLRQIAEMHGVCLTNIIHIRNRETWDWLDKEAI